MTIMIAIDYKSIESFKSFDVLVRVLDLWCRPLASALGVGSWRRPLASALGIDSWRQPPESTVPLRGRKPVNEDS